MSSLSWSANFIKYLLFGFNFLFAITGIILISVGVAAQGAYHGYSEILDKGFYSVPSLLIAIGTIIFIIAFFGCFGAIRENYCMVLTFSILLVLVFILELSAGISGYVLRNKTYALLDESLHHSMSLYKGDNKDIQTVWDEIQIDFQCCGVRTPEDWVIAFNTTSQDLPASCCRRKVGSIGQVPCDTAQDTVYKTGCLDAFGEYIRSHAVTLGAAALVLAFVQLVGIGFACFLTKQIRDRQWLNT